MWALRILSGPQAGHIIPLKPGKSLLGRAPSCEIKIDSASVSKEHATLLVMDDKLIMTDLNSRNGSYVNGVRVQTQRLGLGDKLSLHDILIDVIKLPDGVSLSKPIVPRSGVYSAPPPAWAGNAAMNLQYANLYAMRPQPPALGEAAHSSVAPPLDAPSGLQADAHLTAGIGIHDGPESAVRPQASAASLMDLFNNFRIYIDHVAMPGVYSLVKLMPFRSAIALMVGLYILMVTALVTVPMVSTTKNGIRQESARRAKTIARHLAANNRQALVDKNDLAVSTAMAEREEGVSDALIISSVDGSVIAPTKKRGEFPQKPFVHQARREEEEMEAFIDDSTLAVSVPITLYNPNVGTQSIAAYAIVFYDMGALAMSSSQALSLFIQNLAIALLAGLVFFFFLYKIVEHPLLSLNGQLDDALREGRDDLSSDYRFPVLERLVSNINSALSRIGRDPSQNRSFSAGLNRDTEAENIIRMLPLAALAVSAIDERIICSNSSFDNLVGGGVNLQGRHLSDIPDPALQENLKELLPRMRHSVAEIAQSEIPFYGTGYEIRGQAVMGSSEPVYFLITLNPMEIEG